MENWLLVQIGNDARDEAASSDGSGSISLAYQGVFSWATQGWHRKSFKSGTFLCVM